MSEFRQDATNGRWAIIAPDRGKRPHAGKAAGKRERVDVDPACPFCPGNEGMLPPIIEETPSADAVGWLTRVVPNKYPILSDADGPPTDPLASGYGHHEVIVETPQHDADLPDLPEQDMAALVETWHRRYCAALALPGIRSVQLFRNHGRGAGASQGHSHSQLVALPLVPPRVASALAWASGRHEDQQACATCAELDREVEAGTRLVELTQCFALLAPFAAGSPFEQWIVPRCHRPCFSQADAQERAALAPLLQSALRRLASAAGAPACNVVFEPGAVPDNTERAAHWSIRIVPDLTTPGGFELISGISVNPLRPEDCARQLREAL
ncbi:MAG: hypothetical protein H6917_17800 [Novosphingobium sp.]|nr:hypothetical protein [Novosphingobium sp.]MCP5404231.1 hypothetical protein [Novosphingobium sp.]